MMRPLTCCCLLLAAGAGLYTYQAKHQAELVDREIARVLKLADVARQRASMLRAEYALLNEPTRLSDLAATHLGGLRNTEPRQFTNLAELDRRLPAVGAPHFAEPHSTEPPDADPAGPELPPIAAAAPPISLVTNLTQPTLPAASKPAPAGAARPAIAAQSLPPPSVARIRPVVQKVGIARTGRSDAYVTPVSAPADALARLARGQTNLAQNGAAPHPAVPSDVAMAENAPPVTSHGTGVGRSGVGGGTFSSLGMARATVYPASSPTP